MMIQRQAETFSYRFGATYWHITDKPDFQPDPEYRPENNTTLGGDMDPGIFLTKDVEPWLNGYGYWRPYVSEIEAPDDLDKYDGVVGGYSGEAYVPAQHFDKLKVKRTIPVDAYGREEFGDHGWVESNQGQDFQTGEPITPAEGNMRPFAEWGEKSNYKYPGTAMDQSPEWRENYEDQVRQYQESHPGISV